MSLSEIMFLKYDENFRLPEDIEELFADELRTALVPGVTAEIQVVPLLGGNADLHYVLLGQEGHDGKLGNGRVPPEGGPGMDIAAVRVAVIVPRLNSDEVNYYMESTALSDELDLAEELLGLRAGSSVFVNGV